MQSTIIRGVGLLLLVLGATSLRAETADEVLAADNARSQAMVAADKEALGRLLHDELSYGHSNGRSDTKASLMDKLVSGRFDYEVIDSTAPTARVLGGVGIVTGPVTLRVRAGENVFEGNSIYTAVYMKLDDRWQLVAYHSSPVRS